MLHLPAALRGAPPGDAMPNASTSLADITVWQAALVILLVVAVIGWLARRVWPLLSAIKDFIDDWKGEPARLGQPAKPGVIETLRALKDQVGTLQHEVKPNGGGSLRDAVDRVEAGQAEQSETLREHIDESTADRRAIHRVVDAMVSERRDVHRTVDALTTETAEHHPDEE